MIITHITEFIENIPRTGRLIAFDVGQKKIGVAMSDVLRIIASPHEIYERFNIKKDVNKAHSYIKHNEVNGIIIGLPLGLSGEEGELGETIRTFASKLNKECAVPIYLQDERFTTKQAHKIMSDYSLSWKKKVLVEDKIAASFILQATLDQMNYYFSSEDN